MYSEMLVAPSSFSIWALVGSSFFVGRKVLDEAIGAVVCSSFYKIFVVIKV